MDEHRLPQIHIVQRVERDGRTFDEPVTSPVCDFCGHDSPAWDYDCEDFWIEGTDIGSAGQWAVCTYCSDMIESGDWDGVMERCLLGARKMGIEERVRETAPLLHAGFRRFRYGERQAWG